MLKPSLTKLAVGIGGLALSLSTGAGLAAADPDMGPFLYTTCNYGQVVAALDAQSPDMAAQLSQQPVAQAMLSSFLNSPPDVRQQMIYNVQGSIGPEYVGPIVATANTCNNY